MASTFILVGVASTAATADAFSEPFPGLIGSHDPGFHAAIRVWCHADPASIVLLAGSLSYLV